jgi:hypothetical protein
MTVLQWRARTRRFGFPRHNGEETVLGDFRRIQITEGDKRWLLDSSTVVPKEVGEIPFLSEIGRSLPNSWNSRKDRALNGVMVHCLEDKPAPSLAGRAMCFDKASGTVIAEVKPVQLGSQVGLQVCLRSDYQKFGDRVVARFYECAEGQHPRLEARVVELAAETAPDPALFAPPVRSKGMGELPRFRYFGEGGGLSAPGAAGIFEWLGLGDDKHCCRNRWEGP